MKKILLFSLFLSIIYFVQIAAQPCTSGSVFPVAFDETTEVPPTIDGVTPDGGGGEFRAVADRLVYWLHGLAGTPDNWQKAGLYSKETWEIHSFYPGYTHVGMNEAADNLQDFMDTFGDAEAQEQGIDDYRVNFVIGHSQGGIVTRVLEKRYEEFYGQSERRFHGLVTFGTPHQGAQILNNVDPLGPNAAAIWAADGCESLLAGPTNEIPCIINATINDLIPGLIKFFTKDVDISGAVNLQEIAASTCNSTLPTLIPVIFEDYTSPISRYYQVGASGIEELNQFEHTFYSVAFYGVEEEPVVWKTISSFSLDDPNNFPVFGADYDETVVGIANDLELHLRSKFQEAFSLNCPLAVGGYGKGITWLNNANEQWKAIVGAVVYEEEPAYICQCETTDPVTGWTWFDPPYVVTDPADCTPGPDQDCWIDGTTIQFNPIESSSDGVVLVESAANFPGATHPPQPMPGSNHMQMRNDSNTEDRLKGLFKGDYGDYFITEER